MKMRRKLFSFTFLFFAIYSCGADQLKSKTVTNQLGISANKECSYTTAGPPVCGNDGADYFNKQHAECFTIVKHVGHCQCSNTLMVCGSDSLDHTECEAVGNPNYTIVKFIPCGASEL